MPSATAGPRKDLDLNALRAQLERERDRLQEELNRLAAQDGLGSKDETGDLASYDQHNADQGTELFMREQDQAIHENLRMELDEAVSALHKMDEGTYGVCAKCGMQIPAERLEVLPFALFCMHCADEMEARV